MTSAWKLDGGGRVGTFSTSESRIRALVLKDSNVTADCGLDFKILQADMKF